MTNMTNMTNATTSHVYTTAESAKFGMMEATPEQRMITARFRSPSRQASILIPAHAWANMRAALTSDEAKAYAPLLESVLESAAKSILAKRLGDMQLWPLEIDVSIFSADAILSEASGANTEWMTKEELTAAWEESETRKKFISSPNYIANAAYRKAVEAFKEMIIKLAGKTTQYKEEELDKIMSKLNENDLDTEFGGFVIKRIEQIRAKPAKAAFDLDIL